MTGARSCGGLRCKCRGLNALGGWMRMLGTRRLWDFDARASLHRQVQIVGYGIHHEVGPAKRDYAQFCVGSGPDRVVDLGDDLWDAERLDRHLSGHDIAVVALSQREEDIGALSTGASQDLFVRAVAAHRGAFERLWKAIEG